MACIFEFVMQPIHTHNPAPAHTCYSILSAKALITNKSSVQIDFWEKKKNKQLVPSKLAPVSEVSDKKKKKSQVFLTSSPRNICQIQQCYLLPPLPFCTSCLFSNVERELKALTLSEGEEQSPPDELPKGSHRTAWWLESKWTQAVGHVLIDPWGAGSRAGLIRDSWWFLQPHSRCCKN